MATFSDGSNSTNSSAGHGPVDIITGYFGDDESSSHHNDSISKSAAIQEQSNPQPSSSREAVPAADLASSASISSPKLHGDFRPMFHNDHQARSEAPSPSAAPVTDQVIHHDPKFMEEVAAPVLVPFRPTPPLDDDDVFAVPQSPDLFEDQQVADSQIHETTAYENLPHIVSVKPSEAAEAAGKSSVPFFYKPGKLSPKGAMYTWNGNVYEGHSKVKFFGFNALHGAEMKYQDGKYILFQGSEPVGWRFSPYLPVKSSPASSVKVVPKKSVPISSSGKPTIRPVFFAKRPLEDTPVDGTGHSTAESRSSSSAGSLISDPFEYHAHLQKMAEARLPMSQPPPS